MACSTHAKARSTLSKKEQLMGYGVAKTLPKGVPLVRFTKTVHCKKHEVDLFQRVVISQASRTK